jgi:CheY-like chemotaxis protein/anti-sigma regulatory factor (Ser/Thr protein kinase)
MNADMHAAPRILIVGNDPILGQRLRESPALAACEIEGCAGGCDAVQRLRLRAYDVVLTDPSTPVREDLALVGEIRRTRPGVKAIVLAPAVASDEIVDALRAHVFACFAQPFDMGEIADMVARAVEVKDWNDGIEVVSGRPNWITLRVSCRMITADRLVRFMTEWRADLPEPERQALILAFREMLLNAMEHGGGFDPEQVVEVTAARTARAIVYHLKDPGPGFDIGALKHAAVGNAPDDPVAHLDHRHQRGLRPGGFGILLAQQIVDELAFNERGNEVILIKHTA